MKEVAGPLPPRATLLDPGEELGEAIDLVVVAASGKGHELGLEVSQPAGLPGQVDLPRLDLGRLCRHPGQLVALGRKGDGPDGALAPEVLNEGGARALVLDHHVVCIMPLPRLDNPALQAGVVELLADNVDEVEIRLADKPGGADAKVVEFARLGCRIPGLDDAVIRASVGQLVVELEPIPLDEVAALGDGGLLVLGLVKVRTKIDLGLFQHALRLALRVEQVAGGTAVKAPRADLHPLGPRRYGWQVQVRPVLLRQDRT